MHMKHLAGALLALSLLGASGLSAAAAGGGDADPKAHPEMQRNGGSGMDGMMRHGANGGGMTGPCPMMGSDSHMDPKTAMQMHGEMMKAMGDIMLKYADRIQSREMKP